MWYAFLPDALFCRDTARNAAVALASYVVLLLLALLLQRRTAQDYQERQLHRELEYLARLEESARRAESATGPRRSSCSG